MNSLFKIRKSYLLLLAVSFFPYMLGCRTTDSASNPLAGYGSQLVESLPFVPQNPDACGPATLAMTMAWAGERRLEPAFLADDLSQFLITPQKQGSLQSDMLSAARRWGYMAFPIHSWSELMTELSAQHPVIVLQNLRNRWLPQWHYAVALGFDEASAELILHSGREERVRTDWDDFDDEWAASGRWGLLLLPAGMRAPSQGEKEHVSAASALERTGDHEKALFAYQTILAHWPESLGGQVGFANAAFALGRVDAAIEQLERTVKDHPKIAGAWHNLAQAHAQKGHWALAKRAAREAINHAQEKDRPLFAAKLDSILNNPSKR